MMPTLAMIEEHVWRRMRARRQPLDYSPMSWDCLMCHARAWRVLQRLQGHRISLYQAIKE